jgi:hypothetical protein
LFQQSNISDIITFLQRKDPTLLAGRTPQEAWRCYLIKNTGGGGDIAGLEKAWLAKQGGVGNTGHDLLTSYLNGKGYVTGTISDRLKDYHKGIVTP